MKVKVKKGQGPIYGNYGLKSEGESFNVPSGHGKQLAEKGMVEILDEADTPEDEPKQGGDITRIKESKPGAKRQTKEEKGNQDNK